MALQKSIFYTIGEQLATGCSFFLFVARFKRLSDQEMG